MQCLKKFYFVVAVLGISFLSNPLLAAIHPCAGEFAFQGELLYLFPDVGPTYFVFDSITPPAATTSSIGTGTYKENAFGFKPGFRLETAYGFCGRDVRLEWTRLNCDTHRTVTGPSIDPSMTVPTGMSSGTSTTFPGTAKSSIHLGYDEVSLLVGQRIFGGCCLALDLRGGLEYAYVGHKDFRQYNHNDGTVEQTVINSHFWGIGPEIAIDASYMFCNWQGCWASSSDLSLETLVSGSLLVSQTSSGYNYEGIGPGVTTSNWHGNTEDKWMVVPAWHAQIGLNYAMCFACFRTSLELGYEFTAYNNAIAQTTGSGRSVGESRTIYYNFTSHGPYLALGVIF